jgi:quercetin 2,3-dioxygenase
MDVPHKGGRLSVGFARVSVRSARFFIENIHDEGRWRERLVMIIFSQIGADGSRGNEEKTKMIDVRKADERGRTRIDWLDSRHTFSFGDYYDPRENGFSVLRVINDDWIAAGQGFGTHPHRDMEIITYVLEGAVEHRDSLGTKSVIPAGDVQRMTAGTGIRHSEFNPSRSAPLHLLQIWIVPEAGGLKPGYEQQTLGDRTNGRLALAVSHGGGNGALKINQDAELYIGSFRRGHSDERVITAGRKAYVHVARGRMKLNGLALAEGDGAKIIDEDRLHLTADGDAEVLVFDLP